MVANINLCWKCNNNNSKLLDFMKEKGADFSMINKKGETPLILIANSDSLDDLKFIHNYTKKEFDSLEK